MKTPLVVIGGGGHARVIIDAASSTGEFHVLGFLDPAPCEETRALLEVDRLGGDEAAAQLLATAANLQFALGVGALRPSPDRRAIVDRYDRLGAKWATVIHGGATVASTSSLGVGAVVLAGAIVGPGAVMGRHVIVNSGAIVEHDVEVGDYVVLGPGALLGGGAQVGAGAFVGLGANIRDHVRIGPDATVAMGAVVVDHVPATVVVAGTPARPMDLP
jgi:acetyltransferase EpsM